MTFYGPEEALIARNEGRCDLHALIKVCLLYTSDAGNKWYVLKAVSGKEAKVKEYIEAEMKHNDLLLSLIHIYPAVHRTRGPKPAADE